jgi:hypothetical protein
MSKWQFKPSWFICGGEHQPQVDIAQPSSRTATYLMQQCHELPTLRHGRFSPSLSGQALPTFFFVAVHFLAVARNCNLEDAV